MAFDRRRLDDRRRAPAHTLPEALVAVAVLGALATWTGRGGVEALAAQRLRAASQRVVAGLEEGRAAAVRTGEPCALGLDASGWREPLLASPLPPCAGVTPGLGAGVADGGGELELSHSLPSAVRFTANGLVLDGGTVWLRSRGTSLVRCVVVSLPLGITRVGRQGASGCVPDTTP